MSERKALPGQPSPLGASPAGDGINFAVYSEGAESVDVCLFDTPDGPEVGRIPLTERDGFVWHGAIPGLQPGQIYAYRVHGPYEPEAGLRFNAAKLLIDPYARSLVGDLDWSAPLFGYKLGDEALDLSQDTSDDSSGVPKSVAIDPVFDWESDASPRTPWHKTVLYEVHVKGFSMQNPDVREAERGTYRGLAAPASIEYLQALGVTAVELLPVQAHLDGSFLVEKGLVNYWGYDTIGFFAPEARYATAKLPSAPVDEFKQMVRSLHAAGIEVILDVVYNHTPEGNERGPTLSFRGLDNPAYYRLVADNPRYYMDYTGTGNTLNARHPQVLTLIMDSLRYWVQEMHVDGFRFDLASALARESDAVDKLSAFFDTIHQDPVISQVKLIAEPWDIGDGGYQVGNFPILWTEWNGRYRDSVRRFWKGGDNETSELAYRLTGSSDLYKEDGRGPYASINFITCHDGFTLNDLVSYDEKHNEANGENNADGNSSNDSRNWGAEGPTDDAEINAVRDRLMRSFLATLLFSQGVPMICGGDEFARTQQGNNNAYCQDNELSWFSWGHTPAQQALLDFTRQVVELRSAHPSLRRKHFFMGRPIHGQDIKDVTWLRPDGHEMDDADWETGWLKCFGMLLDGHLDDVDEQGEPVIDHDLLLLFNADSAAQNFVLPVPEGSEAWTLLLDTSSPPQPDGPLTAGSTYSIESHSVVLLSCHG